MLRFLGVLQKKKVVILDSNPRLCGEILAASDTKGTFIEQLLATPAWHPVYSIESMDGPRWEQLSSDFKSVMAQLDWRKRLGPLALKQIEELVDRVRNEPAFHLDSEVITRSVVRIFFELLFDQPLEVSDESLFYRASIEWRKEIAIKGKSDPHVKEMFWTRLQEVVRESRFREGLETYREDPSCWLSLFAQPFLISPQINISDIFVTVFQFFETDLISWETAKNWAIQGDRPRLSGIVLEAIRLRHPFPILERELKRDFVATTGERYAAGTQVFILLDRFKQDQKVDPERWLLSPAENPYSALPFAAGPRMCIGKPIAMELLVEMLSGFLTRIPFEKIQPALGHQFSGRDNDGQTTGQESRYQARVFARALWRGFRLEKKTSGCPWKKSPERG